MGGCLSISCYNKAKLIPDFKENIAAVENKLLALKAAEDDLQRRIEREERSGRQQRLSQVQALIDRVQAVENEVADILSSKKEEFQLLCVDGFRSRNPRRSYVFSKTIFLKLAEIDALITAATSFQTVTEASSSSLFQERPMNPKIVGQESVLERAWTQLTDDGVDIVALHGMGGVGKTTLLTQINNRLKSSDYHYVLWIVVSQGSSSGKMIDDLGEKLGLCGEEWHRRDERENSIVIYNLLKTRRFVLLLDDLWRKVNLSEIGVPYPSRENRCKMLEVK